MSRPHELARDITTRMSDVNPDEWRDEQDRSEFFEEIARAGEELAKLLVVQEPPGSVARRAAFGRAAITVGTPDLGGNGDGIEGVRTDATDTIANVLHAVHAAGGIEDCEQAWESAWTHFQAEGLSDATGEEF